MDTGLKGPASLTETATFYLRWAPLPNSTFVNTIASTEIFKQTTGRELVALIPTVKENYSCTVAPIADILRTFFHPPASSVESHCVDATMVIERSLYGGMQGFLGHYIKNPFSNP
jgi:hypothetical protein